MIHEIFSIDRILLNIADHFASGSEILEYFTAVLPHFLGCIFDVLDYLKVLMLVLLIYFGGVEKLVDLIMIYLFDS